MRILDFGYSRKLISDEGMDLLHSSGMRTKEIILTPLEKNEDWLEVDEIVEESVIIEDDVMLRIAKLELELSELKLGGAVPI